MENLGLAINDYEQDFISFQNNLSKLQETNPNQFVAFKNGKILVSGTSMDEVNQNLIFQGIEPSGTVIEFVSTENAHVIL